MLDVLKLEKDMDELLKEDLGESKKTTTFRNSMLKNRVLPILVWVM